MEYSKNKSNVRFWVISVAVVIVLLGGLFFWFMGKDTWVTGANIYSGESSSNPVTKEGVTIINSQGEIVSTQGIESSIKVNSIPRIEQETKAREMVIKFNDLDTEIKVNKEALQLDALKEVNLKMEDFDGSMGLNADTISLTGKVSRLEVNGVVLSSDNMQITFKNLNYDYFSTTGIELEQVALFGSKGEVQLSGDKLVYNIGSSDKLTFNQVFGDFTAEKVAGNSFVANFASEGISTSGSLNAVFK